MKNAISNDVSTGTCQHQPYDSPRVEYAWEALDAYDAKCKREHVGKIVAECMRDGKPHRKPSLEFMVRYTARILKEAHAALGCNENQ
jgi:hypothetical protein